MGNYRVMYDRSFEAVPEFLHRGRVVTGAVVGLLFRFFKNGKEVFFEEGTEVDVCHNLICSFDKDMPNCCRFYLKPYLVEDWFDTMIYEVANWELLVYAGRTSELFPELAEAYGDYAVSEGMPVEQEEFVKVLRENWTCFHNEDNTNGECLSVEYVQA